MLSLLPIQAVQEQADRKNVSIVVEGLPDQQTSQAIPISQTAALATAVNRDEAQYMIRGDALRLENVLVHFISNAVQYSKANHVIRVKVCLISTLCPPLLPARLSSWIPLI